MTTITAGTGHATLINVFTVAPEKATELAATLSAATEQVMRHQPGFVSANVHISTDHTRVVSYAQWESAEAYAAIFQNPTVTEHMGAAAAMAESFDPKLYTVDAVHAQE